MSFHFITHNLISELICFVFFICMVYLGCYRHGENFKSTAPLEIYLLGKMVMCSILILPAVYILCIFATLKPPTTKCNSRKYIYVVITMENCSFCIRFCHKAICPFHRLLYSSLNLHVPRTDVWGTALAKTEAIHLIISQCETNKLNP